MMYFLIAIVIFIGLMLLISAVVSFILLITFKNEEIEDFGYEDEKR
jgi:hypothetical protein